MQVEIQHRLHRLDGIGLRLSHFELDGEAQGTGDLYRFEEPGEGGDRDPHRMFVEQLGVPVEQGKFGLWGAYDELYRHAITPVGQGVDISPQRQQLHADELLEVVVRESLYEICRVLRTYDYLASVV